MLVHKHLIIRAEISNPPSESQVDDTVVWLKSLIQKINMKILMGPYATYSHVQDNRGITVAAIIETSHVVLHTWDESSPAILQLDVYSCAPFPLESIFSSLEFFSPSKVEYKFLDREHSLVEICSSHRVPGDAQDVT
ncbi:S-adenosylmethionine decarboxylase [Brucella pituitosa]|uniref:S-adenosylmethionine decarboxylase n=1 Tax=Brucella pituitosa TaxID=571256 RepID=UPI00192D1970